MRSATGGGAPLLAVCLLYCAARSLAAPGRSADEVLIGQVDIAMRGDDDNSVLDGNSIDVHADESFAKKCIANEKYYSHGEIIPSRDLGSHCLCVAGEVYCWWQRAGVVLAQKPSLDDGAVIVERDPGLLYKDRSGSVGGRNTEDDEDDDEDEEGRNDDDEDDEEEDDDDDGSTEEAGEPREEASGESSAEASGERQDDNSGSDSDDLSVEDSEEAEDDKRPAPNSTSTSAPKKTSSSNGGTTTTMTTTTTTTTTRTTAASERTTPAPPATCLVMGRTYQVGEVLPRLTGNCVECSCGPESRIKCSPRDCVSLRPQPGGGLPVADELELFGLERDRGFVDAF